MSDFLKPNNPFEKPKEKPKTIPLPATKKVVKGTYKKPSKTVEPSAPETKTLESSVNKNAPLQSTSAQTQKTVPTSSTQVASASTVNSQDFKKSNSIEHLRSRLIEEEKSKLLSRTPQTSNTSSSIKDHTISKDLTATSSAKTANPTQTKLNLVNSHSLISQNTSQATKPASFLDRTATSTSSRATSSLGSSATKSFAASTSTSAATSTTAERTPKTTLDSEITDAEFVKLRDFLYEQSGIFVTESRKYLFKNRLLVRLNELALNSYDEYYHYLKNKDSSKKELNKFYEQMTTNETSFFRNVPQLNTVNDQIFKPFIDERRKEKKLNIFSAGCSSGEEPYTLAIMLLELLKAEKAQWKIKITAGDLSPAMLVAAKEGLYNEYSLRSTPKDYIKKYFNEKNGLFEVCPEVKNLVSFTQINLNDRAMVKKLVPQSDIVFCRNVIIYFDDEVKKNVIGGFHENLITGGALVIGHSETLNNITSQFEVKYLPNTQVYVKI